MDPDTIDTYQKDVPGTVYFVDVYKNKVDEPETPVQQDIVLLPRPLDTPRDPLNWPKYKKIWSLVLATLFACVMSYGENNLGAAWTTISEEADVSLTNMNGGSALNYLLLGFVNILWIPTAMKWGRKIVFIASMTINMGTALWNAYFQGTVQWYLNCMIGGFGTSAYQAIIQLTIFDMFFAHQRGTSLAFYVWGQQLGSILGLITGGYIAEGPGWRWSCKIAAILSGAVVFLFIFTFDDSLFPRHVLGDARINPSLPTTQPENIEQNVPLREVNKKEQPETMTRQVTTGEGVMDLLPRNYWQVLVPIHRFEQDKTSWFQYFRRPFYLFLFPNIIVASVIFAFACTAGIVSFNTISEIMTEDPYNWGTGSTGLMFLAALVGSFIGMGTGSLGDRIVIRLARRNNGYKEPEMRLWTLVFSFIYGAVGYMMYGWGANAGDSWVLIAIGLGSMISQQISAASIATTYAMECFEGISGELVVVLAICSSCINFALSYSVQPFIDATNYGYTFTFFGCLVMASMGLAVPTAIWGKSWRGRCAERYRKFIAEAVIV
ncbi:MFS transporter, putative [Talaromyces stipitatus ATCC 10500]|uniref:MFS transporter, putative n=1 Tax=Talaromyces stipitatus (strain ATCC 10500 / CBS 375.48 / QM 6759 / NRRL 1006) TaxID=441959 RepID=B8MRT6_TALSN|nr:MFS transporter, putative [Talaromyces stipitatus ATCC 10500]EED13270.1 MFS transporter, putative [Talaromyces stipitatus ATCC 10500]